MTESGIEPATFWLVAHRVPSYIYTYVNTLPFTGYVHDIRHRQRGRRNSYRSNTMLCHIDAIFMLHAEQSGQKSACGSIFRYTCMCVRACVCGFVRLCVSYSALSYPFYPHYASIQMYADIWTCNYVIVCVFSFIRATHCVLYSTHQYPATYLPVPFGGRIPSRSITNTLQLILNRLLG
jgi:hypothetical protein